MIGCDQGALKACRKLASFLDAIALWAFISQKVKQLFKPMSCNARQMSQVKNFSYPNLCYLCCWSAAQIRQQRDAKATVAREHVIVAT